VEGLNLAMTAATVGGHCCAQAQQCLHVLAAAQTLQRMLGLLAAQTL